MSQAIVLKSLTIRDSNYYSYSSGSGPVAYTGELEFRNGTGEVKLRLNEDLSKKILAVVGESMIESTRDLARSLTADVISGVPVLPAPPSEAHDDEIL
jgi:hypothetical protein